MVPDARKELRPRLHPKGKTKDATPTRSRAGYAGWCGGYRPTPSTAWIVSRTGPLTAGFHGGAWVAGRPCRGSPCVRVPLPPAAGSVRRRARSFRWWPSGSHQPSPDRARCGTAADTLPACGLRTAKREVLGMRYHVLGSLAFSVRPVAGPAVIARMTDHLRPHGIQLDVAVTGQHIVLFLRHPGSKASLPQRPAAPIGTIDVLHIALAQVLHQQRSAVGFLRREQQVHMVGHQHVGVDRAAELRCILGQTLQVKYVVFVGEEAGVAVVTALDQVQRNTGKRNARAAGHTRA